MKLFSPAKINLYLNVLSKRSDGFHNLDTLFERISLGDEILLKKSPSKIILKTSSTIIPNDSTNLAVKAALLLQREFHVNKGVEIILTKRIPVAAGLGGGSSNAATVLLGLNQLWKLRLSRKKILQIAAKIGSDVPFFVLEKPFALGSGRGEVFKPAKGLDRRVFWHCLVKPKFGISTQQAYQGLSPAFLTPKKANVKMLIRALKKGDSGSLSKLLTNSLELTLNKRVKEILDIKKKLLSEGAFASLMSGSGSTVFGLFKSEKEMIRAANHLRKMNRGWQVFTASTY